MRRKALHHLAFFLIAAALLSLACVVPGHASPSTPVCQIDGERFVVTLAAEPYYMVAEPHGQRLRMEHFGSLTIPGAPLLPMRRFLIALPPATRVESLEILSRRSTLLPGTYQLAPAPSIMFLPDMPRWEEATRKMEQESAMRHAAIYLSDTPFPGKAAWLAGAGTLRKYSYAAIAFCPFTYYPQSGQLEYHSRIQLEIRCARTSPSEFEAQLLEQNMLDQVADEKASRLFSNYTQIADLYPSPAPQLPGADETYDYVIITATGLQAAIAASDFPTWKTAQGYGLRTVLTTDSEITDQPGTDLAEQIRNFLRSYYATWGIEYVLLVGDCATVPMRICYPDPEFHVYDPSDPGLVAPGTPTDYYYADLSYPDALSWDADGDGYHGEYSQDEPDFLAEVSVGRIPVDAPTRITYALDKLVAFEQDTGAWKTNALHGGAILFFENQNHGNYPFIDGATCLDSIETALMTGHTITHFSEQSGIVTSLFDWPPLTESSFTSAWGSGEHAVVNWSGHGWCDGAYRTIWAWDDGDGIPESGNGELQSQRFIGLGSANLDDDHPSIVFAISCNVGYPDPNPYGNLGIDLLTLPGWGSSAGIVSSARPAAISADWKAAPGGTEQICYDFNRYLLLEAEKVGDALYDGKFHATTAYGWDSLYEYMNLYNFNLFGDPSLAIDYQSTSVSDAIGGRERLLLQPSGSNPFASATALRVNLLAAEPLRVTVHDVGGRRVATLAEGKFAAGQHRVVWNGRSDAGRRLAPGLYLVVARTSDQAASRKLVLMK